MLREIWGGRAGKLDSSTPSRPGRFGTPEDARMGAHGVLCMDEMNPGSDRGLGIVEGD